MSLACLALSIIALFDHYINYSIANYFLIIWPILMILLVFFTYQHISVNKHFKNNLIHLCIDTPAIILILFIITNKLIIAGLNCFSSFNWYCIVFIVIYFVVLIVFFNNMVLLSLIAGYIKLFEHEESISMSDDQWYQFAYKNLLFKLEVKEMHAEEIISNTGSTNITNAEFNLLMKNQLKTKYQNIHKDDNYDLGNKLIILKEKLLSNNIRIIEFNLSNVKYLTKTHIANLNVVSNFIKLLMLLSLLTFSFGWLYGSVIIINTIILKLLLDVIRNNYFDKWKLLTMHRLRFGNLIETMAEITLYEKLNIIKIK